MDPVQRAVGNAFLPLRIRRAEEREGRNQGKGGMEQTHKG